MVTLTALKDFLGIEPENTIHDARLSAILVCAADYAVGFCNLREYSGELDTAVLNMAAEDFHRLPGCISDRSAAGMSESYRPDYSDRVAALLCQKRKLSTPNG